MYYIGVYYSNSFNEAVVRVVNLCGDADTTGSICAQIAGAFYSIDDVDPIWLSNLHRWDEREFELRAALLYTMHMNK